MRKITDFIVKQRNIIVVLFIVFSIVSVFLSRKVKINYDMTEYMPADSETRIGLDIMNEEFEPENSSVLNVMFKNLSDEEKDDIYNKLKKISGVSNVDYEKDNDEYNKDENTLFILNVEDLEDSEVAKSVYNFVYDNFDDYEFYTSGNISDRNTEVLPLWIIVFSVSICAAILIIMCESYLEPFLFLTCIGIAVLLNAGTNIIFGTVSNITNSISAILQLALSMDYSIMLINRYQQEKESNDDKVEAMKEALYRSFSSISSSSVTTIVGLITLVFMSFTIGRDLGLVLAKGVLFSLLVIFTCLPALILMCDKLIIKTRKKTPNFNLNLLGKIIYHLRWFGFSTLIIFFIGSYILKGNLGILYTASEIDKVAEVFPNKNRIVIIYDSKDEDKISGYLNKLEKVDKVDDVLGYGNTINQQLTYTDLNDKMGDLGTDVDIEDYLLKIIYYNYFNQNENNTMTFNEFVNFIENNVYTNEKINDEIDDDMKVNITRLGNFSRLESINRLRKSSDIAQILEIEDKQVRDVLTYYNSKNNNLTLSVSDFINFINQKVLTDSEYANQIDADSQNKLNKLLRYTNNGTNNTKMGADQIASLFDMDVDSINNLFRYYTSLNNITVELTIKEFSDFVLNEVITNPEYVGSFDESTINNIKMINTFCNKEIVNKQMKPSDLASFLGLDENIVKQVLLLKYINFDSGITMSITEFINGVLELKSNTNYLDGIDLSKIESVAVFAKNENNINTTKLSKDILSSMFNGLKENLVENIYLLASLQDDTLLTPQEFVDLVLTTLDSIPEGAQVSVEIDENTINSLKLLKLIIDDTVVQEKTKYSSSHISSILGVDKSNVIQIYGLIEYTQGNITGWTFSINEFVNVILANKTNPAVSNNLNESIISKLNLISNIIISSLNNTKYNYKNLASFINVDSEKMKNIYKLYQINHTAVTLTPNEFVDFLLGHKDDQTLSGSLTPDKVSELQIVQNVMNGVKVGQKYSANDLSNLLNIDKSKVELLYGLYISKNINLNQTISLKNFVSFILSDVITNPEYSDRFDKDKIEKLNTVNGIMNATINNTKYTKDEIFTILAVLTDTIDKNLVDLLYVYYGSDNEYNPEWKMTIQDFSNFLNEDILNDERFDDFLDDKMKEDILNSKDKVNDAKKLLVGKKYSRVVLNTKLPPEGKETYDFLKQIYDDIGDSEIYIIGDSPMAYEMSKTFSSEFDKISILTMIFIFIVVAVTFKSIGIPITLVLIIQCAVYMTMGILALLGGEIYFIAILIVQSILMGATIDYAILYTSYYLESRQTMSTKDAVINSYNRSMHTILTSSSILIIATFLVGKFATAIVAKICITLSQGVLCSTLLILLILPEVLALFDKLIMRNKK